MYQESGCFDPNAMMAHGTGTVRTTTATATHAFAVENLPYSYTSVEDAANPIVTWSCTLPMVQQQQNIPFNNMYTQFVEVVNHEQFPCSTSTPDLLNLLHFPTNPTVNSFETPTNLPKHSMVATHSTNVYSDDPFMQQAPPQPALRELLPYMPPLRNDLAFGEYEDKGVAFQGFENGVVGLPQDVIFSRKKRGSKRTNQFTSTTERQRRVDLTCKFDALKELIPNPSKTDRASVVGDAIDYIRELLRTVNELKLLAEKKRHERQRVIVKHKIETLEGDSKVETVDEPDNPSYNESLRSSWIQRKSKDTEVDVHIVDNQVMIKLVQRKKIDSLMHVSKVLDELNLDLQHVAGGHIGDFCSYLFNTKICEGSSVYATAIANKLIEVIDTSLGAVPPS